MNYNELSSGDLEEFEDKFRNNTKKRSRIGTCFRFAVFFFHQRRISLWLTIFSIILGSFLFFGVGKALGATIYAKDDPNNSGTKICYKSGAWPDATCSDGTGNTNFSAAHTAAGAGGTLVIAAGTYTGTQLRTGVQYSSFATGAANVTTRAAKDIDPLDNGASRAGTVTLNGNNDAFSVITVNKTGCVFENLTVLSPAAGYPGFSIASATGVNPVFNDVIFNKGNGGGQLSSQTNCTNCTSIWNRLTMNAGTSLSGASSANLTSTFNYSKFFGIILAGFNFSGTFNNCLFVGSPGGMLYTSSDVAGTVVFNNPIFYANTLGSAHILNKSQSTQTWTINNGVLAYHQLTPDTYGYNGVTINNSVKNQDPLFVGNKYPAVLSFASDDTGNIDWYYSTIAPALEAHGFRGTMALYSTLTSDQLSKALDLQARGHEMALHGLSHTIVAEGVSLFTILKTGYTCSRSYDDNLLVCTNGVTPNSYTLTNCTLDALRTQMSSDGYTVGALTAGYTNVPATVVGYIPAGTSIATAHTLLSLAGPYTITKAGETIQIDDGILTTSGQHSYTLANYNTTTLRTAMIADGYTIPIVGGGYDGVPATCFMEIPAGTTINSALPMILEQDCTRNYIVTGGLNYFQSLGINISTYVCPIDVTSAGLRKWLHDSGLFVGARGNVNSPSLLPSIDAYRIPDFGTLFKTTTNCVASGETEANCIKRNVIARVGYMRQIGQVGVHLAHNESEMNAAQWDAMLDAVEQSGLSVMTLSQLANYIKTYDPSDDLATTDGMTYTRTLVDESDYHLSASSPAIDAATSTSLTTDYEGNPIYGLPDIGAYEYQPTHDMAKVTPDEPQIGEAIKVYGDGKFRNTIDDSSGNATDTAKLAVVPENNATTKWLDLNIAAWNNSGTYQKQWTENSTNITGNVNHTVGDLEANKYYSVYVDSNLGQNITGANCTSGVCLSDENGKIAFTYTGGYSEHTFLVEDATPPALTIISPETGDTVSGDDTITFTDNEETNPQCSIDNANWANCASTITSFNELTGWTSLDEGDSFTLYLKDTDGAGNAGTTSVANLTKADTQAPIRSDGSPSGEQPSDTTSVTLSVTTNEPATCKFSGTAGVAYADMTDAMADIDDTTHEAILIGLTSGMNYQNYVRCQDTSLNANDTDYLISFSVADEESDEEEEDDERDLNTRKVKAASTENTITIEWKTDYKSRATLRYGTDKSLREKKKDNDKEKKHKITLKDLIPDTQYYFRIKSEDGDDNEDKSKIHSIRTKAVLNNVAFRNSNAGQNPEEESTVPPYSGTDTPNTCSYTVQAGDTLWKIANEVYGNPTAYPLIIEKNKDKYPNIASNLSIGQELFFDCQNSEVKGASIEKNDNSKESNNSEIKTQHQESNTKWWNPFSWF